MIRKFIKKGLVSGVCLICLSGWAFSSDIPDPETYFGHKPGADFKLIRWEKIVDYFLLLDTHSDRIQVKELGKTTLGNPFILATLSSPENLAQLDTFKEISKKLAQGRIPPGEAEILAKQGRTVALITCSMHASECGPTQMSPELAYALAINPSPAQRKILDDVILLLVPSWNPDGNILVTDWYRKNLGTPFETSPLPWLYHHYVGHDNNRDSFMHTQVETRYVNHLLYHEWYPQIFMDMHHMGNSDARLFLSPLYEPRHHSLDPLLTREIELTGAYMRTVLEEQGKIGVIHYANWNHWRMSAIHTSALWHNVTTILFEAAGTPLATPIFQKAEDLTGTSSGGLGKQGNSQTINYPSPWAGGWWRLRDIVEYAYWACMGFLETGSLHKEKYLRNMYRMARNSIDKGENAAPFAFIIPQSQKDPNTVAKMVDILIANGVEVHQAENPFSAQHREYPAGTYVVKLAQAYRPYVIDILGPQIYPDRRQYPGGPPEQTFDLTGWTLPYQMGVHVERVERSFPVDLKPTNQAVFPTGKVNGSGDTYFLDHGVLDSYRAVNRLLKQGVSVNWASEAFDSGGKTYPPGTILVSGVSLHKEMLALAETFHLDVESGSFSGRSLQLRPLRLALYQPWVANMDEGWTRWIFDSWEFPYTTIHDKEVRAGGLRQKFDVLLLTNVTAQRIVAGHREGTVPPEYAGGIGTEGLTALKDFVSAGGTLITLNAGCQLPLQHFSLMFQDISRKYPSSEFFCPSAILKAEVDLAHPIGYGMEKTANLLIYGSPLFEAKETDTPSQGEAAPKLPGSRVVVRYPGSNPFLSGRLIGDKYLYHKPALIEVDYGKGKIILFGFRPQNRAQPHGTFMLFFNSLYYGPAVSGKK